MGGAEPVRLRLFVATGAFLHGRVNAEHAAFVVLAGARRWQSAQRASLLLLLLLLPTAGAFNWSHGFNLWSAVANILADCRASASGS